MFGWIDWAVSSIMWTFPCPEIEKAKGGGGRENAREGEAEEESAREQSAAYTGVPDIILDFKGTSL